MRFTQKSFLRLVFHTSAQHSDARGSHVALLFTLGALRRAPARFLRPLALCSLKRVHVYKHKKKTQKHAHGLLALARTAATSVVTVHTCRKGALWKGVGLRGRCLPLIHVIHSHFSGIIHSVVLSPTHTPTVWCVLVWIPPIISFHRQAASAGAGQMVRLLQCTHATVHPLPSTMYISWFRMKNSGTTDYSLPSLYPSSLFFALRRLGSAYTLDHPPTSQSHPPPGRRLVFSQLGTSIRTQSSLDSGEKTLGWD